MKNEKILIYGLHGFLGQGSDFDRLKTFLPKNMELISPDLFSKKPLDLSSFQSCTARIAETLLTRAERKVFIGYSLGGRIGLHFLEHAPGLFEHYIFLSTHSGLESENEKQMRSHSDLLWSKKLTTLPWENFLSEWNSQPVFNSSQDVHRPKSDFDQNRLIAALTSLSLGQQKNMNSWIKQNKHKISWVVGENDPKFLALAESLVQKKILESYSRILSGHRILFDCPADLAKQISELFGLFS